MIIFYAYRSLPEVWNLFVPTLTGFNIKVVDTYKYLGLLLHKQLSWKAHVKQIIHNATQTSHHIARLATYHVHNRPSFKVVRQLVTSVLIPKLVYALPFIEFPYPETHTIMRQMKRLIIYPLRRSLGLPNNAHHESIFIESRVLPLRYLLIYHSILFARRYITQATTDRDAQQRYHDVFLASPLLTYASSFHPLTNISIRCQSIRNNLTATYASFIRATSRQIWNVVFDHFYQEWYYSQHPSNPIPDPHSLFPYYIHAPTCSDFSIPLYLSQLHPHLSSIVSRLRFNRARLNHSLYKRARVQSDICPTCQNNTIETVEHVVMHCPRYDLIRFQCFCDLSALTQLPPLTSSFVFPFLLCCFPSTIPPALHARLIARISLFLDQLQRARDM
jgi:hypothetical protein